MASVEEATALIQQGIQKPILVLGLTFEDQDEALIQNSIRPPVCSLAVAQRMNQCCQRLGQKLKIHLAIDTGMSRIGFQVTQQAADEIKEIASLEYLEIEGIFTHFARADEIDKKAANQQMERFLKMIKMLEQRGVEIPIQHCSNSAGIVDLPQANMNLVRAGITLYGLWPSNEVQKERFAGRPVLSLYSQVAYVKELEPGREISYGGTYKTQEKRIIATIPVGYGDGYARGLSNKGYVLIKGKRAPITGRVCMDQFMVDVTDIEDVQPGDKVTLIGRDQTECITMEEVGDLSGRFNYEFACCLGKRIPRVYYRNGKIVGTKDYFTE